MDKIEFYEKYKVNADYATDTGCRFLRTISVLPKDSNYYKTYFVAESCDPCPIKKCGQYNCRNYGKNYDNQDRLILI